MSRYIERSEGLPGWWTRTTACRCCRTTTASWRSRWPHHEALHIEDAYRERHAVIVPRAVFEFVTLDREFAGSILSCLRAARENARAGPRHAHV